jgi:hypothetical protein
MQQEAAIGQELEDEGRPSVIIVIKAATNGGIGGWKAARLELLPDDDWL